MAIDPEYMDINTLNDISKVYNKNFPNNILLNNIFQDKVFNLLHNKISSSIFTSKFDPCRYRYSITKCKELDSFLYGIYFESLLNNVLGFKKFNIVYEIRKFDPGDFTLLHDSEKSIDCVDFILDLSKFSEKNGGYIKYLNYKEEVLYISTKSNSLSFVNRKDLMSYVKYVNHKQKESIFLVCGTINKILGVDSK